MKAYFELCLMVMVIALAVLLIVMLTFQPIRAAGPWYVAPDGDDGNDCLSPSAPCATINGALGKASPGDTIYVATGTYTATGDEVVLVDKDATLSGGWDETFTGQSGNSTIDGEGSRRGIAVESWVTATVERFTVRDGSAGMYSGGGIDNGGTLTLNDSTVSGNTAGWWGGGIYNDGTVTLNSSTISGNTASYNGGGISNNGGTIILNNSTVSDSTGGGIENWEGTMTLSNSAVSDNTPYGISSRGTLTLTSSTVTANTGSGIGVHYDGVVMLADSTISANTAAYGGGIANGGTLTLNSCTVSGNTAVYRGGGIDNWGGTTTLNNSTISGNASNGSTSQGGGIFNNGTLTLNSSTVSGNMADGEGGGICGSAILKNTIVASNTASWRGPDCYGSIGSSGYNLIGDTADCNFSSTTGDLTDIDAQLGMFEGSPGYHPLRFTSPAIDAGDPDGCTDHLGDPLLTDQRGTPRPLDGDDDGETICDIGSYEFDPDENPITAVYLPVILRYH